LTVVPAQDRLRNDLGLYCVGWGVKLYSFTHSSSRTVSGAYQFSKNVMQVLIQLYQHTVI